MTYRIRMAGTPVYLRAENIILGWKEHLWTMDRDRAHEFTDDAWFGLLAEIVPYELEMIPISITDLGVFEDRESLEKCGHVGSPATARVIKGFGRAIYEELQPGKWDWVRDPDNKIKLHAFGEEVNPHPLSYPLFNLR